MEIKKGTLVVVKKWGVGVVQEIIHGTPITFIVKTEDKIMRCDYDELIPLVEDCGCESVQDFWERKDFSITQFQIMKNLTIMIHNLQKQLETFKSTVNGTALEELRKTQEHLREHELKPH